jgi:hypothetical protein
MNSAELGAVISRAWSDRDFKERLMTDPAGALHDFGVVLPSGVNVHVHANTSAEMHIVLPPPPAGFPTSEAQIQGAGGCYLGCRGNNSW